MKDSDRANFNLSNVPIWVLVVTICIYGSLMFNVYFSENRSVRISAGGAEDT